MAIFYNPKMRLSKKDKYAIEWLEKHGIKGNLIYKSHGITQFYLRKPGMLSSFLFGFHYTENDLGACLRKLDKALTERVGQEEAARQANIVFKRLKRLAGFNDMLSELFLCYLDILEYCNDVIVTEEILKLRDEYHRLHPKQALTYKDGYDDLYVDFVYDHYPKDFSYDNFSKNHSNDGSSYWDEYIFNYNWRREPVDYIPIDE